MKLDDPSEFDGFLNEGDKDESLDSLAERLAELRLLAIRLDLKVVGAIISSAIGMIPLVKH